MLYEVITYIVWVTQAQKKATWAQNKRDSGNAYDHDNPTILRNFDLLMPDNYAKLYT